MFRKLFRPLARKMFGLRTRQYMEFDWLRMKANIKNRGKVYRPSSNKLHFGCGLRRIEGWLNVDVTGSELNLDLASRLPFPDAVFDAIASQHVIEHLDLREDLMPLLKELRRVARPGAELWLDCPDLGKVCRFYVEDKANALRENRYRLYPNAVREPFPSQQEVNDYFQYGGQHKNFFDFELMEWVLKQCGFSTVRHSNEKEFMERFPEFPFRDDDYHSLYVCARA
jgi:predicted SAM-dependent methyltransferase